MSVALRSSVLWNIWEAARLDLTGVVYARDSIESELAACSSLTCSILL